MQKFNQMIKIMRIYVQKIYCKKCKKSLNNKVQK